MATDLDGFLFRLKNAISLQEIVEKDGVELRKDTKGYLGRCPFHSEDTASFHVYPREERYWCFGCRASGDVVEYVQKRKGLDFWRAVEHLAQVANIPLPERDEDTSRETEQRRNNQAVLDYFVDRSHEALLADEAALQFVQDQGITRETIIAERIGLATYKGAIEHGRSEDAKRVGLLDGHGSPTITGRIVYPIRHGGRTVNISARARGNQLPKYRMLAGCPIIPAFAYELKSEKVPLVEGYKDAVILRQIGFHACATGLHFKEEWLKFCSASSEYVCCYDNDANEAGQKGAQAIAEILFDAGFRVSIAELPPGMDPADVALAPTYGAGALAKIVNGALPWLDWLIERLPAPRSAYELQDRLERVLFPKLLRMPPVALDGYLQKISKQLGSRIATVRQSWEQWSKAQKVDTKTGEKQADAEPQPEWEEEDPIQFNPAQWFGKGLAIFSVYVKSNGVLQPFIVASDRRIRYLDPRVAHELGLVFRPNKYPSEQIRWSVGTKYAFSVNRFLTGDVAIDPAQLYRDVKALIRKHIWFPSNWNSAYDFLTLWTIGTYVHQLYDSYPYVHIRAIPDSGKSTLLSVLMSVAFNGTPSAATTESVVSRSSNSDSATMGIDEAENYRSKSQDETSTIFEVLKGGYKKGLPVRKAGSKKDNFRPETFDTYCPKIFASTQPIDPILSTRCIDLPLEKTTEQLPPFLSEEIDTELRELRGHCYCWALTQWENVREAYLNTDPGEAWLNRSWELWKPILALAEYFSAALGENLTAKLEIMANHIRQQKKELEREQNFQQRLCGAILDFIRQHHKDYESEFYPVPFLINSIEQELGLKEYSGQNLSRFLFEEAHFCLSRSEDKKKLNNGMFQKQVWHYRLHKPRVWKQAVALFGFEPEILKEIEGLEAPEVLEGVAVIEPDPFNGE